MCLRQGPRILKDPKSSFLWLFDGFVWRFIWSCHYAPPRHVVYHMLYSTRQPRGAIQHVKPRHPRSMPDQYCSKLCYWSHCRSMQIILLAIKKYWSALIGIEWYFGLMLEFWSALTGIGIDCKHKLMMTFYTLRREFYYKIYKYARVNQI